MTDVKTVRGPIVETYGGLIYSVTLLSGHVVTNPSGFGVPVVPPLPDVPFVAEEYKPPPVSPRPS